MRITVIFFFLLHSGIFTFGWVGTIEFTILSTRQNSFWIPSSFLKDKIQSLDIICPFINSIGQKWKLYKHAVSTLICLALLYLSWYTLQNYYSMTLTKCPNWRWGIKRSQQQKKWPQVKYKIWPSVKKIHLQIIGQGLWSIIESHTWIKDFICFNLKRNIFLTI